MVEKHRALVATVPTVYGIETLIIKRMVEKHRALVATVPTVYGIETIYH